MTARILVVHDQEARREQMKEALARSHSVTLCTDASEAINILKRFEDAPKLRQRS